MRTMSGTETRPAGSGGEDLGPLMTPTEVAKLFRVDPKTVTRWAQAGRLSCVRTLGGHRRYPREEVMRLLHAGQGRARAEQESYEGQ